MSKDKKIKELEVSIKKMKIDNARVFGDYSTMNKKKHAFLNFFLNTICRKK